jgi:O-antigen ligase
MPVLTHIWGIPAVRRLSDVLFPLDRWPFWAVCLLMLPLIMVVGGLIYGGGQMGAALLLALVLMPPALALLWLRPEFGLLLLLFLSANFIEPDRFDIRLPIGGGLDLRDLMMLGLLVLVGFRELARRTLKLPWPTVSVPLALFVLMAFVSAFYALLVRDVARNWALNDLRILLNYTLFFVTAWSLQERKQLLVLLWGIFLLADVTALVIVIQQFLGPDNLLLPGMALGSWEVWGQPDGSVRIVPPGHELIFFALVLLYSLSVLGKQARWMQWLFMAQFGLLSLGMLLTYTRSGWVATAVALTLITLIILPRYKQMAIRLTAVGIPLALILLTLLFTIPPAELDDIPYVGSILTRGLSIFAEDTTETNSLQWRAFEYEKAMISIRNNPWLGVGLGNNYRDITVFQGEAQGLWTNRSIEPGVISRYTRYLHSSYLSILVKMGIPTFAIYIWFCVSVILSGFWLYFHTHRTFDQALILAVTTGFIGLLQWSLFHSRLIESSSVGTLSIIIGMIAGLYELNRAEQAKAYVAIADSTETTYPAPSVNN